VPAKYHKMMLIARSYFEIRNVHVNS